MSRDNACQPNPSGFVGTRRSPDQRRTTTEVATGVLEAIGQTPLVRFERYLDDASVDLIIKWEAANPGGSAKDRPARGMIERLLEEERINDQSTIIESSSGNMGIGLAQACRYFGLPFVCVVDPRTQRQNIQTIEALGGTIDLVSQPVRGDFLTARIARVGQLLDSIENSYWPNQYVNPNNPSSHYHGTITEIDRQLSGEFDDLFVATSSTGTAQGCRDYLLDRDRPVRVHAVDAFGSVLFGGKAGPRHVPGLGAGQVPGLAEDQSFDAVRRVSDLDCVTGCRRAARREAMLVGGSGGGVLEAIRRAADCGELSGRRVVAILHDGGSRYLDTIYNDAWVQNVLGCDPKQLEEAIQESASSKGAV